MTVWPLISPTTQTIRQQACLSTWPTASGKHNYEMDFLLSRGSKICPVEVKSSGYKTHKSMDEFCKRFSQHVGMRYLVYTKDLRKDEQLTNCLFSNAYEDYLVIWRNFTWEFGIVLLGYLAAKVDSNSRGLTVLTASNWKMREVRESIRQVRGEWTAPAGIYTMQISKGSSGVHCGSRCHSEGPLFWIQNL